MLFQVGGDARTFHSTVDSLSQVLGYSDSPSIHLLIQQRPIDALEEGSQAEKEILIKTEVSEVGLRIAITDNGPGIPDSVRSKMFDPFFTTKAIGKGSGLGLSISYQIVYDRHKGSLKCNSTEGKGTQFLIEIPTNLGR